MAVEFIDPGRFRHALSLQRVEPISDGAGGHDEAWSEEALVWAHVEPISARQIVGADQRIEETTHRVTFRFREGVVAGMRFVRNGRTLHIVTVQDPDETGRYLLCRTREITA